MILECKFSLREKVYIDEDSSLITTITAIKFGHSEVPIYEVSYWSNGDAKAAWVEEYRLNKY